METAAAEFLRTEASLRNRHLKTLRRRMEYLAQRIERIPDDTGMDYLKAERAAIEWVLDALG